MCIPSIDTMDSLPSRPVFHDSFMLHRKKYVSVLILGDSQALKVTESLNRFSLCQFSLLLTVKVLVAI